MATYYVDYTNSEGTSSDANNGISTSTAWIHCPDDPVATDTSDSKSPLSAGDTVIFKGGITYSGNIPCAASGNSGNRITYDGNSAGSWGAGDAIINGTFNVGGYDYITIDNFTFDPSITSGWLIDFGSSGVSNYVTISNCYYNAASGSYTTEGFWIDYGVNTVIENNTLLNIGGARIIFGNTTSNHDITVRNNRFETTAGAGGSQSDIIKIADAYNVLIEGNKLVMRTNRSGAHNDMIQTYESSGATYPYNWTIRYNWIELDSPAEGLSFTMMRELGNGYFKVYGNIFLGTESGNLGNGFVLDSISTASFYIYNNTFVSKDGPPNTIRPIGSLATAYVKNNVHYSAAASETVFGNDALSTLDNDYNSWYGGNLYRGTTCANFKGSNSACNQDPLFTDYANDDFSLQSGSPCISAGINLSTEYENGLNPGCTWPNPELSIRSGIWDIGAYVSGLSYNITNTEVITDGIEILKMTAKTTRVNKSVGLTIS